MFAKERREEAKRNREKSLTFLGETNPKELNVPCAPPPWNCIPHEACGALHNGWNSPYVP